MTTMDNHYRKLEELCFICGDTFKKPYIVSNYKESLKDAFYIDVDNFTQADVYPKHMCEKCYYKMKNVIKRGSTVQSIDIKPWSPHKVSGCDVCQRPMKKGGKKPKLKTRAGRPNGTVTVRTRERSDNFKKEIPDYLPLDTPNSVLLEILPSHVNPQLSLCLCTLCKVIIRQPIMIKICEHGF